MIRVRVGSRDGYHDPDNMRTIAKDTCPMPACSLNKHCRESARDLATPRTRSSHGLGVKISSYNSPVVPLVMPVDESINMSK